MAIETYTIPQFADYTELFGPFWGEEHLLGYESLYEFASFMQELQVRSSRRYHLANDLANQHHDARRTLQENNAPSEMVQERMKLAYDASMLAESTMLTMMRAIMRAAAADALAEGDYETAQVKLDNFKLSSERPDLSEAKE